ncbi:MAG: methyltransferase [Acidimicrobiia bacterium]
MADGSKGHDAAKPPRLPPAWAVPPVLAGRNALGRLHRNAMPPIVRVFETTFGFVEAKAVYLAAEFAFSDFLAEEPLDAESLARVAETDADATARLLRLLEALGYFSKGRDGRWRNTAMSELLRSDRSDSVREWVRFLCGPWHGEIWNHAAHSVRTGRSASVEAFGAEYFDWLTANPAAQITFDAAMEQSSQLSGPSLVSGYDFSGVRRICDVGGGTGALLATVLAANPSSNGVLFDLPEVIERAAPVLRAAGVQDRVEAVGGSFFDAVPTDCDRYLLKAILHDWADPECVTILSRIRDASPTARVLVVDQLMPTHRRPHPAKDSDLMMLVLSGSGRERTEAEFAALVGRAGYRVNRVLPMPAIAVQELVAK